VGGSTAHLQGPGAAGVPDSNAVAFGAGFPIFRTIVSNVRSQVSSRETSFWDARLSDPCGAQTRRRESLSSTSIPLSSIREPNCSEEGDTKARLLDAVVEIFADRGFHATSMRAIARRAGTGVSAAHYHFGSKEELLRTALRERAAPLNSLRLQHLERLEAQAEENSVTVEDVLGAFIRPIFEWGAEASQPNPVFQRLAARLYVDSPAVVEEIRIEIFESIMRRFQRTLEGVSPETDSQRIELAFQLALGVIIHTISRGLVWCEGGEVGRGGLDPERIDALVNFSAAGYRAVVEGSGEYDLSDGRDAKSGVSAVAEDIP